MAYRTSEKGESMSAPGNVQRLSVGAKDDWRTPPDIFAAIQKRYNVTYTLDVAASDLNHLTPLYYTGPCIGEGSCNCGLCASWGTEDGTAWCNNPYLLNREFSNKAISEARRGNLSTLLVPAATDTRWWADLFVQSSLVVNLTGRLRFLHPETGLPSRNNTIGSTLFFTTEIAVTRPEVEVWDWKKNLSR